jgi:hypothetical protein
MEVVPGDLITLTASQSQGSDGEIRSANSTWFYIEAAETNENFQIDEFTAASGTFTHSLTVSGVPVSTGTGGGGASTLQEAYDGGDGTISTTGGKPFELTGTGELVAVTGTFTGGLTVGTGSTVINDHEIVTATGSFTEVTITGTAKFGVDNTPEPTGSPVIFASQEIEQTTTSLSLIDASIETAPLLNGVEYLVIYAGNTGNSSVSRATELQVQHAGVKIGGGIGEKSGLGTFGNNHFNGNTITGIYKVTGNGTGTIKMQFRTLDVIQTAYVGAMSIICIPLDNFTQNVDYYYEETANSETYVVVSAPIQDPPTTALISSNFAGMAAGDWIFLWSQETAIGNGTNRGFTTRFQVDGNTIGPSRYARHNTNGNGNTYTFTGVNTVNIPSPGDVSVDLLVSSLLSPEANSRRGRVFAINTALFTQVLSTTNSAGFKTSTSSFQDFNGLNTTITPTNVASPIIILTSATSYTTNANTAMTSAIRNETDAIDYRIDSGSRNSAVGGVSDALIDLSNSFMSHFEERTSSTEYRYQIRSTVSSDVAVGRNSTDTGGELSEMIVWEFIPSDAEFVPITQTCIDDDEIQTGNLIVDQGTFRVGLTVSGVPVATGTGGGSGVTKYQQQFTDELSVSITHNIGNIIHMTTILDSSDFVIDATLQYGENTDTVTFSEAQSGSAIVMG